MIVEFTVNGEQVSARVTFPGSLLDLLRDDLGLPGSKDACEQGECGSCSVILDGELVCSCLVMAADVAGSSVTTVEFGICRRQSPSGNSVSLATHTSMLSPTPRSASTPHPHRRALRRLPRLAPRRRNRLPHYRPGDRPPRRGAAGRGLLVRRAVPAGAGDRGDDGGEDQRYDDGLEQREERADRLADASLGAPAASFLAIRY